VAHTKEVTIMETIDTVAGSAHEAVDKIADATRRAAEALSEKGQQVKKSEERLMEDCRSYVRENPVSSVALAVGAGFMLSRLL
jgi:ElaB/YqjD/DUF883 family membrane-anchored ribosome-binding protein